MLCENFELVTQNQKPWLPRLHVRISGTIVGSVFDFFFRFENGPQLNDPKNTFHLKRL